MINSPVLFLKNNRYKIITGVFALILLNMSMFIVDEGYVGIVKTWGKATKQVGSGLNFKAPFMQEVVEIEIRVRRSVERMGSATSEEMPVTVPASFNWSVNKDSALDLYIKYGGLQQFENRVLDSRFRNAVKASIPKFTAEKLIQDRNQAATLTNELLREKMKDFPMITISDVQIEDVVLPAKYIQSIENKQTQKNNAVAEQHILEKQSLQAQQAVNTAKAEAEAIELTAKAEANKIKMMGQAEADAIRAKGEALKQNPGLVDLIKAERWDGQLPSTMLGDGQNVLMSLK